MNKDRRKRLAEAVALLERAQEIVRTVAEEEREAFDNLPSGLQETEKGQKMEQAADDLDTALDGIEAARDEIQEVIDA
jgi:hypothetical protein